MYSEVLAQLSVLKIIHPFRKPGKREKSPLIAAIMIIARERKCTFLVVAMSLLDPGDAC